MNTEKLKRTKYNKDIKNIYIFQDTSNCLNICDKMEVTLIFLRINKFLFQKNYFPKLWMDRIHKEIEVVLKHFKRFKNVDVFDFYGAVQFNSASVCEHS